MMILPSDRLPALSRKNGSEPAHARIKRVIDFVLAAVGLALLLPGFALIAIAIRLDSQGPVFYTQERVGLNRRRSRNGTSRSGADARRLDCYGRPFRIYKFRSMVTDAERNTGPVWATENDSRVTRVGAFLRRTRLDEFPQLINVLRGEMSLVGPRPERPTFVRRLADSIPDYPQRCSRLPGITGLAQVKSRYDSSLETVNRKLQYDLYYVRNAQLLLDLKIMAATVKVMAKGEGAH
jgi:lipopolysaccharide/colanic/teichoic acid biosynthesis glycosyltransferase